MAGEGGHLLAGLNVPQHAGHVTAGGEDLIVVEEAAAGEVARVSGQLPRHAHRPVPVLQAAAAQHNKITKHVRKRSCSVITRLDIIIDERSRVQYEPEKLYLLNTK